MINKERTLLIIKPDGVQRGLIGEVIRRLEQRGLKIAGLKMIHIDKQLAHEHYKDHVDKDFFEPLVEFITSSPVVVAVLQGAQVVRLVRNMMGALNPEDTATGTIRGDLSLCKRYNVVHGSDSPESAVREIAIFFKEDELFDYPRDIGKWLKA